MDDEKRAFFFIPQSLDTTLLTKVVAYDSIYEPVQVVAGQLCQLPEKSNLSTVKKSTQARHQVPAQQDQQSPLAMVRRNKLATDEESYSLLRFEGAHTVNSNEFVNKIQHFQFPNRYA